MSATRGLSWMSRRGWWLFAAGAPEHRAEVEGEDFERVHSGAGVFKSEQAVRVEFQMCVRTLGCELLERGAVVVAEYVSLLPLGLPDCRCVFLGLC